MYLLVHVNLTYITILFIPSFLQSFIPLPDFPEQPLLYTVSIKFFSVRLNTAMLASSSSAMKPKL